MSFLAQLNFFATVATFGCVSFAASNFGIKLGKLASFSNTSGYKYISESTHKDALYDAIIKTDSPSIAKTAQDLKNWCSKYEKSIRYWKDTSKYCLIKNNVRHQLINQGHKLKDINQSTTANGECTKDILDAYADDTLSSLGYLLGKSKCVEVQPAAAAAAA